MTLFGPSHTPHQPCFVPHLSAFTWLEFAWMKVREECLNNLTIITLPTFDFGSTHYWHVGPGNLPRREYSTWEEKCSITLITLSLVYLLETYLHHFLTNSFLLDKSNNNPNLRIYPCVYIIFVGTHSLIYKLRLPSQNSFILFS